MIVNPISAYRTFQKANKKGADDTFVMEPPKGPVRQIMGGASEFYGIWKFAKNKEGAIEFLKYYADHWPEAFKASEGLQQPLLRQPRAEADADPVERSDLDAERQAGDPAGLGRVVGVSRISGAVLARRRRGLQRLRHLRHDGEGSDRQPCPPKTRSSGPRNRAKPSSRSGTARPDRRHPDRAVSAVRDIATVLALAKRIGRSVE